MFISPFPKPRYFAQANAAAHLGRARTQDALESGKSHSERLARTVFKADHANAGGRLCGSQKMLERRPRFDATRLSAAGRKAGKAVRDSAHSRQRLCRSVHQSVLFARFVHREVDQGPSGIK